MSQLMYIGYAVAHNMRINFAQLIWTPMVRMLIAAKRDLALGNKTSCYYPIFLNLILKVENIMVTLIPKLNSIQATQMNTTDDIASMTDSHAQLANCSLQLDFIQGQLFNLHTKTGHSDSYMKTHFKKVEDALDHLTTGMQLLYTMIKYGNPPTAKDRAFFEGGSGGSGGSGEGGVSRSGTGGAPR